MVIHKYDHEMSWKRLLYITNIEVTFLKHSWYRERERENEIESYVVKTFCLYLVINEKMYPIYDGG